MKTFKVYQDSGHGWLAVKRKLLIELEIDDKITPYSYERGNTVYLEEDCDVSTFIAAYKAKYGNESINTKCVDHGDRSWIRSLNSYRRAVVG